ncbi:glyoxalase/bleomycin resistance/dioxygenase family protein [Aliifodinibius salipaludis]|uniref:Glyoxalase/bleomycin resistance/dioxygenase family protein n=1 Tax=Fodinibius salipaludis TaxID=2032627 RepID=A0A2A2GD39_9BACT|nr:ArsI/CadI family heavy metal resistance metalloenzyme [Aliifodinibius salipaludis]PAU94904.1 glyoxalase/bleomycin resistance/dioxygenase family protein [Aliifodinibius salipaludis]
MKRMHVMLKVNNLNESIEFYSTLFGVAPTKQKEDYAKWMLDDPRVNFSIAEREGAKGIEHLGIEAESEEELLELRSNINRTHGLTRNEGETTCCYANSDKSWVTDPQGVEWEAFHTFGESENYAAEEEACC